jgi:hypothetical protein
MSVIKKAGQFCLLYLRSLLFPLYKIPFILLNLLFGMYAFVYNDQGQDLMATLNQYAFYQKGYLTTFICFLVVWGIGIWNAARLLLTAANLNAFIEYQVSNQALQQVGIDSVIKAKGNWAVVRINLTYKEMVQRMIRWLPRVLSVLPYVFVAWGCIRQYHTWADVNWINLILFIILTVLQLVLLAKREQIAQSMGMVIKKYQTIQNRFTLQEVRGIKNIMTTSGTFIYSWVNLGLLVIMLVIASYWAFKAPSDNGCPGLIIVCGLSVYILLGLIFNLLMLWYKVPVFLLLLLVSVLFFSTCNNNHRIQVMQPAKDSLWKIRNTEPFSDITYAQNWLKYKWNAGLLDTNSTIFIVASEGGGIRNCYWTYLVLNKLQQINDTFYDRTFAVSGVSGGSIGLGMYYNYQYYKTHPVSERAQDPGTQDPSDTLQRICSADYLSRVSFGFMFPDMLQRFLPFAIDRWDRSKMLANSFDDGFSHMSGSPNGFLSKNYLEPWMNASTAYRYPVVLYNTILNEAGAKAVFSPYRLSAKFYPGVVDLLTQMNASVPTKEAMTSSARFPILTAPGLVTGYDNSGHPQRRLGHISDGGGYENTGIQTAEQTALLLRYCMAKDSAHDYRNVKIKIIYIGTGSDLLELSDTDQVVLNEKNVINRGYEFAWANGGIQTIFGWIKSAQNVTVRLDPSLSVLQFGLNTEADSGKHPHRIPLGWYLSDTSRHLLELQLTDSLKRAKSVDNSLKSFKQYFYSR